MMEQRKSTWNHPRQNGESGAALIVALLAMTVIAGLGFALMVSSSTESLINASFRRSGMAFYSSMSGVEEMRGQSFKLT